MLDIMEAWNNGKGFINTIRIISKIAIWAGLVTGAVVSMWQAFKHFGQS